MSHTFEGHSLELSSGLPPGQLPSERYILTHWDSSSPLSTREQCKALALQFLSLGPSKRFHVSGSDNQATPEQLAVLESWRPSSVRAVAANQRTVGAWVRTCFSDDGASQALQAHALYEVKEGACCDGIVIQDRLFEDCTSPAEVLALLPELIVAQDDYADESLLRRTMQEWTSAADQDDKDEIESAVQNYAISSVLVFERAESYLDPQLDETGQPREGQLHGMLDVWLLDMYGNMVRRSSMLPRDAMDMWLDFSATGREPYGILTEGELGHEYKPDTGGRLAPPYAAYLSADSS